MKTFRYSDLSQDIKADLKKLSQLDNYHGWLGVLVDFSWVAIAITFTEFFGICAYPFTAILIGVRMRGLADLLHHASHGTLAKNKRLNFVLGTVFSGWLVGQLYSTYRKSHVKRHHPSLGDPDVDPDEVTKQSLYEVSSSREFLLKHLVPALLGFKSLENVKNLYNDRFASCDKCPKERAEVTAFCMFWLAIVSGCIFWDTGRTLLIYWLIPFLLPFQSINYLIEITEHFPRARTTTSPETLTRNRFGPWWESFLFSTHDEGFHLVHHLAPGVPFWNLEKAHRVLLRYPNYASANTTTGGIFMPHFAQKSIVAEIMEYYDEQHDVDIDGCSGPLSELIKSKSA